MGNEATTSSQRDLGPSKNLEISTFHNTASVLRVASKATRKGETMYDVLLHINETEEKMERKHRRPSNGDCVNIKLWADGGVDGMCFRA